MQEERQEWLNLRSRTWTRCCVDEPVEDVTSHLCRYKTVWTHIASPCSKFPVELVLNWPLCEIKLFFSTLYDDNLSSGSPLRPNFPFFLSLNFVIIPKLHHLVFCCSMSTVHTKGAEIGHQIHDDKEEGGKD